MKNKLFRRIDALVLLAVALVSGALYFLLSPREAATSATVRYQGDVIDSFVLDKNEKTLEYTLREGTVRLLVNADGVRVLSSPCQGQNCVHAGAVNESGDAIVCLPLGFTVTLSGNGEHDGITG